MTDQRWLTAHHEASHVVMAYSLGVRLGAVSIQPGKRHLGVAFTQPSPFPQSDLGKVGLIVPRLPARIRRSVEYRVMVLLAGEIGEGWAGSAPASGFVAEDADIARGLLGEFAVGPGEFAELEAAAARAGTTDEDKARELALALAEDETLTRAYVVFLRACTERYVRQPDFGREVRALAAHLLREETLSGGFCRNLLDRVEKGDSHGTET